MVHTDSTHGGLGELGLHKAKRNVTDGTRTAAHDIAHLAGTGKDSGATIKEGPVHNDGLESLARTGCFISIDELNRQIVTAHLAPIGDLAGIDIAQLIG